MAEQNNEFHGTRFLVIAAALAIIIFGINQAQSVVSMFLVSGFLALIGTPPVLWLERKHVPSALAVTIVMATIIILLLITGVVVGASLSSLSEALPFYQKHLEEQILALKPMLASKKIIVTDKVLLEYFNPGPVLGLAVGLLTGMGVAISSTVLILLVVTFILLEASSFPIKLRAVLGNPHQVFPQFTKFVNDIKRYMILKTILNIIAGVFVTLWLFFLGVDFPVLWGFVAFLLHYIPNLGSVICAVPAVLLAFIEYGLGHAVLVAVGYIVVGFTLGNVVEPRLMGRKLGLSTLVVFLSLILWGSLLGPIGVVLCIPFTMTLKFGLEMNEDTRWIAVLLGSEKPAEIIPAMKKKSIQPET
ncbi:MAG TPA: AI-2E family transporter [Bacteroidota bacterium]|nr:AI-2E family transporter [Bacteroidota bacterium]